MDDRAISLVLSLYFSPSAFVYPGPGYHPIPLVRTSFIYPGRDLATSIRSFLFFSKSRLALALALVLALALALALAPLYDRLFYPSFFVSRSNDASTFPLPSNYFNGNCFSLVSIRVYNIRNFPIVVIKGDQAFSCIDTWLILLLVDYYL